MENKYDLQCNFAKKYLPKGAFGDGQKSTNVRWET